MKQRFADAVGEGPVERDVGPVESLLTEMCSELDYFEAALRDLENRARPYLAEAHFSEPDAVKEKGEEPYNYEESPFQKTIDQHLGRLRRLRARVNEIRDSIVI